MALLSQPFQLALCPASLPLSLTRLLALFVCFFHVLSERNKAARQLTKLIKRRFNIIKFQFITFRSLPLPPLLLLLLLLLLLPLLYYFYSTWAIFIVAGSK